VTFGTVKVVLRGFKPVGGTVIPDEYASSQISLWCVWILQLVQGGGVRIKVSSTQKRIKVSYSIADD
jgi:hypothetical protein